MTALSLRKEEELPCVGFEPTTLCSLGECSTNWTTQLVGVQIYNTTQDKGNLAIAQIAITRSL